MFINFKYVKDESLNLDRARDELIRRCITLHPHKSVNELSEMLKINERTLYRHLARLKIKTKKLNLYERTITA